MPGIALRSGGSVSPGRVAHSGRDTGPDGGFGFWLTGGEGLGIVDCAGASGAAAGAGGAVGAEGGAGGSLGPGVGLDWVGADWVGADWTVPSGGGLVGAGEAGTYWPAGGWAADMVGAGGAGAAWGACGAVGA